MKRTLLGRCAIRLPLLISLLSLTGLETPAIAAVCPAELGRQIEAIAAQPALRPARLGIRVETQSGDLVYERDSDRYFVPASNVKLLTTAAALQALGPDFRIRTSVYGSTNNLGLTTLRLVGHGDPSLSDAELTSLSRQLRQQGVRQVASLTVDDSYFPGQSVNPNWEWEDVQAGYGAPVNSLIVNRNALGLRLIPQQVGQPLQVVWDSPALAAQWQIDNSSATVAADEAEYIEVGRDLSRPILQVRGQLRVGSEAETAAIALPNPAQYFLQQFQAALAAEQISVGRTAIISLPAPQTLPELAAVESAPLRELLIPTNRNSNNLYAEALLKTLGVEASSPDRGEATALGITAVQTALAPLGVDSTAYVLADGSGLSRHNLATPAAFVQVLQAMNRSPFAEVYRSSLSTAGVDGTLRNRFRGTAIAGRLQGKTGAISRNAALSGYLDPAGYDPLVLSIVLNNVDQPGRVLRQAIDEVVQLLFELQPC
ncbi:MAG: D-alanyl-D-alanine carboxypeptidase/D-alanyl-D-alanine-endopeptidase [Leptolyngbyaceae cyanobacterium RM1_1_2]|nr:D-alanyl-D-alanine carboxypeptidase/D-alanyl-D-alanine-endopeptidase [Leptolyngbyaceae cyanobacterium RM1_1_2]